MSLRRNAWTDRHITRIAATLGLLMTLWVSVTAPARADSVNSPIITLNVDANRAIGAGNGAGGISVTVNTITLAETTLPEYQIGGTSQITLKARPGYQFDPTSNITAQSATIGINGGSVNAIATIVPTGAADEVLTFSLTSGNGNNNAIQDIIRINGVKLRIISAPGAAGPAQSTIALVTASAGGAFTNQGIVGASITKGAPDHLVFSAQPGDAQAGNNLLPAVKIVDFGENLITNDVRTITLALQANPGAATLLGTAQRDTSNGIATWADSDALRITTSAAGYTLRASHSGASFLTSDSVDSGTFEITAGAAGSLEVTTQPLSTLAGQDIVLAVTARDSFGNPASTPVDVTLDSAANTGGWPLLVDTSLTKTTVNGVATWSSADHLRINKAVADYRLTASGLGAPVLTNAFNVSAAAPTALRFVQQPSDTQEAELMAPPATVEVIDAFGNRASSTASVQLNLVGTACGAGVTGNVVAAAGGLAEFSSLAFGAPCTDVVLQVDATGLIGTVSNTFNVTAAPQVATRMVFSKQPANSVEGAPLLVDVTVFDQFDQPFTSATVSVTLSLATNPGPGALLAKSALTKQTVGGVASWVAADELRIDVAGNGYRLGATGVGASIASNPFAVTAADDEVVVDTPEVNGASCGACGAGASLAFIPLALICLWPARRMARRSNR